MTQKTPSCRGRCSITEHYCITVYTWNLELPVTFGTRPFLTKVMPLKNFDLINKLHLSIPHPSKTNSPIISICHVASSIYCQYHANQSLRPPELTGERLICHMDINIFFLNCVVVLCHEVASDLWGPYEQLTSKTLQQHKIQDVPFPGTQKLDGILQFVLFN